MFRVFIICGLNTIYLVVNLDYFILKKLSVDFYELVWADTRAHWLYLYDYNLILLVYAHSLSQLPICLLVMFCKIKSEIICSEKAYPVW